MNLLPYCFGDHRNSSGSSDTQSAKHKSTIRAKIVETTLTAVLSNPQQTMLFVCPLGETSPSAMIILIEWLWKHLLAEECQDNKLYMQSFLLNKVK